MFSENHEHDYTSRDATAQYHSKYLIFKFMKFDVFKLIYVKFKLGLCWVG